MSGKGKQILSGVLALSLAVGLAVPASANTVASETDKTSENAVHPSGLVGFDGEYALSGDGSPVSIIVELEHQPAALVRALQEMSGMGTLGASQGNLEAQAEQDREEFLDALSAMPAAQSASGSEVEITYTYTNAINGYALTVPDTLVPELAKLECVYAIYPNEEIQLDLDEELNETYTIGVDLGSSAGDGETSAEPIGMLASRNYYETEALNEAGYTGAGVTVGVIDSGIDYEHPDLAAAFSDKMPGTGETAPDDLLLNGKFYGRNYIKNGREANDPMDDHGHGTHVSGTITGRGEDAISTRGIAPEVTLVGYKVITASDSVSSNNLIKAMEDACKDGCDILNMSLGWSNQNGPIHVTTLALNNLALQYPDTLFVVCAGNNGSASYTLWSPSTSPLAFCVANAEIPFLRYHYVIHRTEDVESVYDTQIRLVRNDWSSTAEFDDAKGVYLLQSGVDEDPDCYFAPSETGTYQMLLLPVTEPTEDGSNWDNLATGTQEELDAFAEANPDWDWTNTMVVLKRGQNFDDTVKRLRALGGGTVVVINTEGRDDADISYYQSPFENYLPVFTVGYEDGLELIEALEPGQACEVNIPAIEEPTSEPHIYTGSSRGPVESTYDVRPDIAASGTNVLSTVPRTYFDPDLETHEHSYASMTGTSMATPHIVAFAALLKQEHPEWNALQLKAHLANTANPDELDTEDRYLSVYDQGSGMVRPADALANSDFYATASNLNAYYRTDTNGIANDGAVEGTTISFGVVSNYAETSKLVPVTVYNDGADAAEFSVEIRTTQALNGVSVTAASDSVTVEGGSQVSFDVTAAVSAEAETGFCEGYVVLTEASSDITLVLPFAIYVNNQPADEGGAFNEDFTFTQVAVLSNGEHSQIKDIPNYSSFDSLLHYQFANSYDMLNLLIGDAEGNPIGLAYPETITDTSVGDNWYWYGTFTGSYYPYDESGHPSQTAQPLPEGQYQLLFQAKKLDGKEDVHAVPFVVDNTLPELTLSDSSGSTWYYTNENGYLVLSGRIYDAATAEMQADGLNSTVNQRIFGKTTSQQDNIVVVQIGDAYYRATIQEDGTFTVRIPDSGTPVESATVYYGDHFLPVGSEAYANGQRYGWSEEQASKDFDPQRLSYEQWGPQDAGDKVPWMFLYAYRAANMDSMQVTISNKSTTSGGGSSSVTRYTIQAQASEGGTISPNGSVRVERGDDQTFTMKAEEGYVLSDVLVDGKSVGAEERYTFENVRANHTIEAVFETDIGEGDTPLASNVFQDLNKDAWYVDAVNYVYANGLMNGTSETTFAPNTNLTRAMLVQILYNLEENPAAGTASFHDVASDAWYADAVAWGTQAQIISGVGGDLFAPNADITREQVAVILYRYAQYKGYDVTGGADLSAYVDADSISTWALSAMQWANQKSFVTGTSATTLAPQGAASRAQAASMLMRFYESVAVETE
ncbi:S8 family serine peptidase [Flavonifractor sp. An92]|uniref:S8 family serine peptidase n=1 Tax=Flavonifractor sp. An92 TaxID=1965666 RepID=UPI000B3A71B6|nr:S8 family serine peptidase [Flavonifractor sp. An92]